MYGLSLIKDRFSSPNTKDNAGQNRPVMLMMMAGMCLHNHDGRVTKSRITSNALMWVRGLVRLCRNVFGVAVMQSYVIIAGAMGETVSAS